MLAASRSNDPPGRAVRAVCPGTSIGNPAVYTELPVALPGRLHRGSASPMLGFSLIPFQRQMQMPVDGPDAPVPKPTRRVGPWVPIRSLAPRHRERILAHLQQLDERDRYLRFGYVASNEHLQHYVESLDFGRDEVFGIFDRRLRLIALAHLAYESPSAADDGKRPLAEFGVSVLDSARGRGFGTRLFEHAMLHARNRGIDTLFIHALSENAAMLSLARKAGADLHRDGSESQAVLKLPPETLASHVDELVGHSVAELDYRFKVRTKRGKRSTP
jgi:GNAT superfamily N-acetyltransferase